MSVYQEIVGQTRAIKTLLLAPENMTHAWLFTGPPGSGRSNLAKAFAASLICPSKGCGTCTDCTTALLGTHPDFEIFAPQGVSITVDEIRELVSRSAWGASIAPWRITIIEDCDRMTESAANALLKALEEPAERTLWLLCAPSTDEVLPTIRSRCRLISLSTPTTTDVADFLKKNLGISDDQALLASTISQGHVGRAKYYATDRETLALRRTIINLFLSIKDEASAIAVASKILDIASTRAELRNEDRNEKEEEELRTTIQGPGKSLLSGGSRALKELEKSQKSRTTRTIRDELDTYFIWLQTQVRDALLSPADLTAKAVNPDLLKELQQLQDRLTFGNLKLLSSHIEQYRSTLESNAAQLLALEAFLFDLLKLQSGHQHPIS